MKWEILPYLPHLPDIAPSDYHLFQACWRALRIVRHQIMDRYRDCCKRYELFLPWYSIATRKIGSNRWTILRIYCYLLNFLNYITDTDESVDSDRRIAKWKRQFASVCTVFVKSTVNAFNDLNFNLKIGQRIPKLYCVSPNYGVIKVHNQCMISFSIIFISWLIGIESTMYIVQFSNWLFFFVYTFAFVCAAWN